MQHLNKARTKNKFWFPWGSVLQVVKRLCVRGPYLLVRRKDGGKHINLLEKLTVGTPARCVPHCSIQGKVPSYRLPSRITEKVVEQLVGPWGNITEIQLQCTPRLCHLLTAARESPGALQHSSQMHFHRKYQKTPWESPNSSQQIPPKSITKSNQPTL